jgi:hypothetical protein
MVFTFAVALALASTPQASAAAADASKVALQAPTTVVQLDSGKLKGEPWRLAWSSDGTQFYLATIKQNGPATELTHYVIDVADGNIKKVDDVPPWASEYWGWKSAQAAPGAPAFKIQLDTQRTTQAPTARPMGGDLARGGGSAGQGTTPEEVASATDQTMNVMINTMRLKGEVLGTWTNQPIVPGLTFGWGPKGSRLIAFAGQDGRLVLMDEDGRKQHVNGTNGVRLPAWSDNGKKLAWIERVDKKKFRVQLASTQ